MSGTAWWKKHRQRILAQRRLRYATDAVFREDIKRRTRSYGRNMSDAVRARRYACYWNWKNPGLAILKAAEWREKNLDRVLKRAAELRVIHRERNRDYARQQALNLTESYVRNQLSKYSEYPTDHWSPAQVRAKRWQILRSRVKRVSPAKADEIRSLYVPGGEKSGGNRWQLARQFGVSSSLIWLIVKGKSHKTEQTETVRAAESSRETLRLLNAGKELSNYAEQTGTD
jgi:hypothetical protein